MITVGVYGIADTTHGRRPTYTHDHGVAFMRDGLVLDVVELERWTGRKHDNRLPDFIDEILDARLPPDEPVRFASANAFLGNTFLSRSGNLRVEAAREVRLDGTLTPAHVRWHPNGLRERPAEGWIVPHELAHLGALLPFVGSFEPGSLLAHIDGGASVSACSFWLWTEDGARLLASSWDRLKAPVNNFNVGPLGRGLLGLPTEEHLSMPGKLMGFAGLGEPSLETIAWLSEQGWFLDHAGEPQALLEPIGRRFGVRLDHFDTRHPVCQHLAACIQRWFEDQVVEAVLEVAESVGARRLYLSGGAALNIPTNTRLAAHFDEVVVPPCTIDSGLALGAAAWVEHLDRGRLPVHAPYLQQHGAHDGTPPLDAVEEAARLLAEGAIVGVCNGAGEVGPRALGHRSLLARPDDPGLRRRLSEEVKRREWYRPVAPMVHESLASEVLGERPSRSPLSRWMLGAWPLADAWQAAFAGVAHADGTVRAQVVPADDPEQAWHARLLEHLWEAHGIAGLINTSFNARGEPMLQRHADALPLARRLGLDAVVVHGSLYRP